MAVAKPESGAPGGDETAHSFEDAPALIAKLMFALVAHSGITKGLDSKLSLPTCMRGLTQGALHNNLQFDGLEVALGAHITTQIIDIETAMIACRAAKWQLAIVSPITDRRRMHTQDVGGMTQADPLAAFVAPCPVLRHRIQSIPTCQRRQVYCNAICLTIRLQWARHAAVNRPAKTADDV